MSLDPLKGSSRTGGCVPDTARSMTAVPTTTADEKNTADAEVEIDLTLPSRINPEHAKYLASRGILVEFAEANGLRSFAGQHPAPAGLAIPRYGAKGRPTSCCIRRDAAEGFGKFWSNRVEPYFPRSLDAAGWRDPSIPKVIVEGPVKALAYAQHGVYAIGLAGVRTGHDTQALKEYRQLRLHEGFDRVALDGATVVVFFDAGIANNPDVMLGAAEKAIPLAAGGARVLLAAPPLDNGADQGPDDYLARHGWEAAWGLIFSAEPADPIERLRRIDGADRQAASEQALKVLATPYVGAYLMTVAKTTAGSAYDGRLVTELQRLGVRRPAALIKDARRTFAALLQEKRDRRADKEKDPDAKPRIEVREDDIEKVNDQALHALAKNTRVFRRGGRLVEVHSLAADDENNVTEIGRGRLMELLSTAATFYVRTDEGPKTVPPPKTAIDGILDRGHWPGVRPLNGISFHPLLRADGSIHYHGYDPQTGYYAASDVRLQQLPHKFDDEFLSQEGASTLQDLARIHLKKVLDVVDQFPFEGAADRSAWLSVPMTVLARPAIRGEVPATIVDANTPGTGKTKLARILAAICGHAELPILPPLGHDDAEERKRITSLLLSTPELALIDNVSGSFGSSAIDGLLTTGVWMDRLLGGNDLAKLRVKTCFLVTGNNIEFRAPDTARRVVYVRLTTMHERPEEQTFRVADIVSHAWKHHRDLCRSLLIALSAYCHAGRPTQDLSGCSYPQWSDLVRSTIVWAGYADPLDNRSALRERTDKTTDTHARVVAAFAALCADAGTGLEVAEVMRLGAIEDNEKRKSADLTPGTYTPFRDAISALAKAGTAQPSPSTVAYWFGRWRDKVVNGLVLRRQPGGDRLWWVERVDGAAKPAPTPAAAPQVTRTASRATLQVDADAAYQTLARRVDELTAMIAKLTMTTHLPAPGRRTVGAPEVTTGNGRIALYWQTPEGPIGHGPFEDAPDTWAYVLDRIAVATAIDVEHRQHRGTTAAFVASIQPPPEGLHIGRPLRLVTSEAVGLPAGLATLVVDVGGQEIPVRLTLEELTFFGDPREGLLDGLSVAADAPRVQIEVRGGHVVEMIALPKHSLRALMH